MKAIKGLIAAAIAMSLLLLPGGGPGTGDDDAGDDRDDDESNCSAVDLKQGARVPEAKLATAQDGSKVFTKIELVPSA